MYCFIYVYGLKADNSNCRKFIDHLRHGGMALNVLCGLFHVILTIPRDRCHQPHLRNSKTEAQGMNLPQVAGGTPFL